MRLRTWLTPPRQMLALFLSVATVSCGAVGTLAWQILRQDRDLEAQRRHFELESAADRLVAEMRQSISDLRALIDGTAPPGAALPANVVAITIAGERISSRPADRLLYQPATSALSVDRRTFEAAERLEFSGESAGAARAYADLAAQADPSIRAGALMRLGRTHRKAGNTSAALKAYQDLDALGATQVEDFPASLVAAVGRLDAFREADRPDDARREAEAILASLSTGRWQVTQVQYAISARWALELVPNGSAGDAPALIASHVATDLWHERDTERTLAAELISTPSGVALVVWQVAVGRLDAIVAGPAYLSSFGRDMPDGSRWALSHEDRPVVGDAPVTGASAVRVGVTTGLPWTVHVFRPGAEPLPVARAQVIWLVALVTAVLATGWYFIFRSLARERHVARLQSDFVAAVSHEFRSPLTSLTHAADVLAGERLSSEALRKQTYQVLVRDTARLRNLVEGLLAFGRLGSGAPFQFEDADVADLVRATVQDFTDDPASQGFDIHVSSSPDTSGLMARIDAEALARAIRNLLDNAVKYSPDARQIDISVTRDSGAIAIAVRDRGIGIPAAEQQAIFEPFVRGTESTIRRIRGTGIGLAMVRQIARAHGGDVFVTSTPGEGSVFTIRVPAVPAVNGDVPIGVDGAEATR